jgi:hypothetical protein
MGRRSTRSRRPRVEQCERRALLSTITDIMAANSLAAARPARSLISSQESGGSGSGGFVLSPTSIAVPSNQGPPPPGTNLAITPTGTLTPRQLKIEKFSAVFSGPYTIGPGRTSTEALQTFITGRGAATTMSHCDIQLLIITPKDPAMLLGGISTIFDRNLNSNTSLGLDVFAPQQNVDRAGRPNHFPTVTIDVNASAGLYDNAFAQGVVDIRYIPSGRQTPGVISQGTAIVTIHAQIYATRTAFILRNANLDP